MDPTGSKNRRQLEDRARILAALSRALEDRVTVLRLVSEAEDREGAREVLMAEYGWDKVEATAVLDLQLLQTVRGRRERIAEELNQARELLKTIQ